MSTRNQATILDCRGQRCPTPILALSKKARGLASHGGLVEVLADDDAFPLDLKAWCRSAGAELVHLVQADGFNRGLVRVRAKAGAAPEPPAAPLGMPRPPLRVAAEEVEHIDCRGLRCPEPILRLSKLARGAQPGHVIEISADDAAFPLDIESWCRSSGATLEALDTDGAVHSARVVIRPHDAKERTSPSATPPPVPAAMVPPVHGSAAVAVSAVAQAPAAFTADLRSLKPARWESVLDAAASALEIGQRMRVLAPAGAASSTVVRWAANAGHVIKELHSEPETRVDLEVAAVAPSEETTALAKATNAADCTLLVLHNDHESLLAALLVAVGAASQDKEVVVFFTFWGLNMLRGDQPNAAAPAEKTGLMQSMMKMMMPSGPQRQSLGQMHFAGMGKWMLGKIMKDKNIMSLSELMDAAEAQGVRFIACTMSMEVMGITKRDLQPRDNLEFGGVAAFVEAAHGSGMSLVF